MTKIEIVNGKRRDYSSPLPEEITEWRWVEEVREPQPAYDSRTQKLVSEEKLTETQLIKRYVATNRSDEEVLQFDINKAEAGLYEKGFDTGLGYSLAIQDSDRSAFTQLLTLLNLAQVPDEYEVKIKDITGKTQTLSFSSFKSVILNYGMYYQSLFFN